MPLFWINLFSMPRQCCFLGKKSLDKKTCACMCVCVCVCVCVKFHIPNCHILENYLLPLKLNYKKLRKNTDCKDVNVRLVFQSGKLRDMFSMKDNLLSKSMVVYKSESARCNSCYVGDTTRHFSTNLTNIYRKVRKAKILLINLVLKLLMLPTLNMTSELNIQWLAPKINKQINSYKMTRSLWFVVVCSTSCLGYRGAI